MKPAMHRFFPLREVLPELSLAIERELLSDGLQELANQVKELSISRWTHDVSCGEMYVTTVGRKAAILLTQCATFVRIVSWPTERR